jgi:NTE family protein
MSHAGVARIMRDVWGDTTRIEDLPIPLAIVTADLVTGREVVLNRGLLWAAALAGISIPGIYPPQRMGGRLLVDGGVVDPVPSGVVRSLGADIVIAVRLSTRAAAAVEFAEAIEASGKVPSVVHTILRSRDLMLGRDRSAHREASVVIEPEFLPSTGMGLRDFSRGQRFVEIGEAAADESLPRITARLPWLAAAPASGG